MPRHSQLTGTDLHLPVGHSTTGRALVLVSSQGDAYRIEDDGGDPVLNINSNADADGRWPITWGGGVGPRRVTHSIEGIVEMLAEASAPTTSATGRGQIYTRSVSGRVELMYRDSAGTEVQITSVGVVGSGFDPTDISVADNVDPALRVYQGANDYLRLDTSNTAEELLFGNATTNPYFGFLGTGIVALGGSAIELGDGSNNFRIGNSSAIGAGSTNTLAVGRGANTGTSVISGTAIGVGAAISGSADYCTLVGQATSASQDYGTAIGYAAVAGTGGGTALGASTNASGGGVALGRAAIATSAQLVAGSSTNPITEVIFGEGNTDATPPAVTIRQTNASGTNVAGGATIVVAGRSTGTGAGGTLSLAVSPAGTSGASLNAARNVLAIAAEGSTGARVRTNTTDSDRALLRTETLRYSSTSVGPTTAWSLDTSALGDGAGWLVIEMASVVSGAGDRAAYVLHYAIARDGATLSVAAGSGGSTYESGGAAGWDATVDASGDTVRLRVTAGGTDPQEWVGVARWMFAAQPS